MLKTPSEKNHRRQPSAAMFKELTQKDAENALNKELGKLLETVPSELRLSYKKQYENFQSLFRRYLDNSTQCIEWSKIVTLADSRLKSFNEINKPTLQENKILLNSLVVIKLNGGLGTSMGCTGPKSLISVRSDLTFLDITIQQIEALNKAYGCYIPLVLMNSFNTKEDTEKVLRKYQQVNVSIHSFEQSKYPRLNRESLLPIATVAYPDKACEGAWYPPGHGDVYRSFVNSGLADKFLKEGKKWVFISNIDNLGATVDCGILKFLQDSEVEFVMELTDKTGADVKGGTLIEYENKLRLLEVAQVPKEHVDEFSSIRKFRIFNTNNLWISLSAINKNVINDKIQMEIIVNPKTLETGENVIQLEEAVGAAIKCFDKSVGLKVPRSRFLPVKTTSDLLLLMSNLYSFQSGELIFNKARNFPTVPLVKLGTHFKKVREFLNRFANIPNMLELDHLTVSGDVTFGKDVQLRGTVIIIANHGERIDIPSGAILENKIVSGNLRILDH